MRTRRAAAAAVITTSCALLLSGCFGIESTTSSQPTLLGPVRLVTVACEPSTESGCTAETNNNSTVGGGPVQLLYAVRLPTTAVAPATFTASSPSATTTMTRNPGYEQQLEEAAPAGAGQRWWGYLSAPVEASSERVTFDPAVTLGRAADGSPSASPLAWRSVVGGRTVSDTLAADRPVDCTPSADQDGTIYSANGEEPPPAGTPIPFAIPTIVCVDSTDEAGISASDSAPFVGLTVTGAPAAAAAGSTGTLAFTLRRSGTSDQSVSVSTAGGPAGATRTPSATSLPLSGEAARTVTVAVAVPAGTAGGAYPVTLTATAPGGRSETASAVLTVSGDTTAPVLRKVKVKKGKLVLTSSEAAALSITVKPAKGSAAKSKKKLTRTVGAGKAKVKLPRLSAGRYKAVVKVADVAGNRGKRAAVTFTTG